ncbi:MAG: 30S ribosomal protein S6 [Candidatus Wildermuthbacteria bacterium RIFCSPLOWO2_02_FULL_47_10]|nr:MAG: 30S ribosomal protein S6 [Candidatus Wildermuthbacteria bacterium RIFCSPLOWO2_02_FULL_47_10]
MNCYELSYLVSPDISSEHLEALRREISALIENEGGVLNTSVSSGQKHLAYPIKKRSLAHLETLRFYIESGQLPNLNRELRVKEHILRFLLVQKKVPKSKPASVPRLAPSEKPSDTAQQKSKGPKVELEKIEEKLEELLGS